MENLQLASEVELQQVSPLQYDTIKRDYYSAVVLDKILQSLNRITIRSDGHMEITFAVDDALAYAECSTIMPYIARAMRALLEIELAPPQKHDTHDDRVYRSIRETVTIEQPLGDRGRWNISMPKSHFQRSRFGAKRADQLLLAMTTENKMIEGSKNSETTL